ncbi:MAG: hypothetical protein HY938_09500 [Nitrosomonadales bacterium]|nr:hypothetical protein [Nitrosomonadales bacterium]
MKNLLRYQIYAFIPALVLLAGGFYFKRLVMFAIETNFALNAIILGMMLVGVLIMHQLIWSLRRQSKRADVFVQRIQQGEEMSEVLKDPEMGASDIGLVCDHLAHTADGADGRPVAAVEAGLRSLHVTLDSRQELAQFMVGFMVALGLMGTFIGILETLVEIGNMIGGFATSDMQDIDKSFMGLISDLTKPLQGMGTAFSASMFGLLGSLCLGLTMVAVRRCTEEFLTGLRHAINQMIKDRRTGRAAQSSGANAPERRSEDLIREQHESNQLFHKGLEAQLRVMQKLETLEQRMSELNTAMQKQVEAATETNSLLRDSSIPRQATEQFMGQIKVLASAATENSANFANLLPALNGVTQRLGGFSEVLLKQREQMQQILSSSAGSQDMIRNSLISLVEKENEIRGGMFNEISMLRKFMLEMQPVSTQMVPLLTEINSRLNELSIASHNQEESTRMMSQSVTQTFGGLKMGIAEMLHDAEKSRQLQSEVTSQLVNSQRLVSEIGGLQQSLTRIAHVLANSVATSQALVEEVKNLRESVVSDMRIEMQDALRQHKEGKVEKSPADSGSGSGKPKA